MKIALAQVDADLGDVEAGFKRAEAMIADANDAGADLVVFPELALSGFSIGPLDHDPAIRADDPRLVALGELARGGVLIGFPEAHARGTFNSAAYLERGRLVHVHRKLYLPNYTVFEEKKHFLPGQGCRSFPVLGGSRATTLICNDAWQPPLAFLAAQDDAEVLLVPSASTRSASPDYDARDYWQGLTRFYGRMHQLVVVFVNRVGVEGEGVFWGGSHVAGPSGELLAEAGADEELLLVDVDLGDVRRRRRALPLAREARLGLLHREIGRLIDAGGDL